MLFKLIYESSTDDLLNGVRGCTTEIMQRRPPQIMHGRRTYSAPKCKEPVNDAERRMITHTGEA